MLRESTSRGQINKEGARKVWPWGWYRPACDCGHRLGALAWVTPTHLSGGKDIGKHPWKWERGTEYIAITWASKQRVLKDDRIIKLLLFKEIYSDREIHCTWE